MAPSSIPSSIPMYQLQSYASSDQDDSKSALSASLAEHIALGLDDVREHIVDIDNITDRVGTLQEFVNLNEIEADNLKKIEGDLRLKLILSDWQSRLRESHERKERKRSLSLNVKNEIYQLIGFFSVFQGVVLTTVAQASQLTCHNWWGPFSLSLLASFTTLVGVDNKFHNFIKWKRATDFEVQNSKVWPGRYLLASWGTYNIFKVSWSIFANLASSKQWPELP